MLQPLHALMQHKFSHSPLLQGARIALQLEGANRVLLDMFGEDIGSQAQAIAIKHNGLTIACMHSSLAQEIRLREHEFLERLRSKPYTASGIDRLLFLLDDPL